MLISNYWSATPGFTFYKNQCGGKNYVLAGDWVANYQLTIL